MTLHKTTEFYTEWFSVCHNTTSKFRDIAIFKSFVEQNNGSNKTCRYVHNLLPYQISCVYVKRFMSYIHWTKNMNCNFQPLSKFKHFVLFIIKFKLKLSILWRSNSMQNFTIPHWFVVVLNPPQKFEVRHFGMVDTMGLKSMVLMPPSTAWTLLNLIKMYQLVQNVLLGNRQTAQWYYKPHFA
jgi:hypothetical protein